MGRGKSAFAAIFLTTVLWWVGMAQAGELVRHILHPIGELTPITTIRIGKTADWVAIGGNAVWVGSTGPNAVSEIDSRTNRLIATVPLPGNPCAGLALGHGGLALVTRLLFQGFHLLQGVAKLHAPS